MARTVNKLSDRKVTSIAKSGLYGDGNGLYLRVGRNGAKSWAFRFMKDGKPREMGLGGLAKVSLKDAREAAEQHRRALGKKIDPLAQKQAQKLTERAEAAKSKTFDECAAAYIAAHAAGWKNPKHRQQWKNTLATYVSPVFGAVPIANVNVDLVMRVLAPLWSTKPETANRIRGRIERVVNWAKANNIPIGENPARWRDHLANLLPPRAKVRKVKHHAALPYKQATAFMVALRSREGVAARALEFLTLTAARTSEVLEARWSEFNLAEKVWTVPEWRMKAGKQHRVPLSDAAIAVLENVQKLGSEFVFPGSKPKRPLSNMAMLNVLGRMNSPTTTHGLRSTFKDWARSRGYQDELSEIALAHVDSDETRAAYARDELLEQRRPMMEAWSTFLCHAIATDNLVHIGNHQNLNSAA